MIMGMEQLLYQERQKKARTLQFGKKTTGVGDMIEACKITNDVDLASRQLLFTRS